MAKSLKELADERGKLVADNRAILNRAEAEGRALSAEEQAEYDQRDKDIDALDDQIQALTDHQTRLQRQAAREEEASRPLPRQTAPAQPGSSPPRGDESATALTLAYGRQSFQLQADAGSLYQQVQRLAGAEYQADFGRYLAGAHAESLGLIVGDDPKGGYLVPMTFLGSFIKFLDDAVWMRQLATVLPPTTAKSVGALSYDQDPDDADWTAEVPASDITEDDKMRFGARELTPHLLSKRINASRKILRSNTFGLESWIAQRLAYKFGVTEEKHFFTGHGAQQPLGIFTASNDGVPTSRDVTASAATAFSADDLIDTTEALKDGYKQRATWLASREFRKRARKLKDGEGRYLLTLTNNASVQIPTLLDIPLRTSEFAPDTFTTGKYIAALFDPAFYWIQDGLNFEIQRLDEIAARRNQVEWIARREVDAQPVLAEAFARLKLA